MRLKKCCKCICVSNGFDSDAHIREAWNSDENVTYLLRAVEIIVAVKETWIVRAKLLNKSFSQIICYNNKDLLQRKDTDDLRSRFKNFL